MEEIKARRGLVGNIQNSNVCKAAALMSWRRRSPLYQKLIAECGLRGPGYGVWIKWLRGRNSGGKRTTIAESPGRGWKVFVEVERV